jgi:hypothetical protein
MEWHCAHSGDDKPDLAADYYRYSSPSSRLRSGGHYTGLCGVAAKWILWRCSSWFKAKGIQSSSRDKLPQNGLSDVDLFSAPGLNDRIDDNLHHTTGCINDGSGATLDHWSKIDSRSSNPRRAAHSTHNREWVPVPLEALESITWIQPLLLPDFVNHQSGANSGILVQCLPDEIDPGTIDTPRGCRLRGCFVYPHKLGCPGAFDIE